MLASAGIKAMRQQFQTSTPFPHLVIDRLFSPKLPELMYAEFDDMKWNDWRVAATAEEIKRGSLPPVTNLDNRLVVITYLNEGWIEDDGGLLELGDKEANACVRKVVPLMGRTILLYQSALSLHGVSLTKKARDAKPRRSAACYYYSNGREDESELAPTEYFQSVHGKFRFNQNVKMFIPPVLVNLNLGPDVPARFLLLKRRIP